MSDKEKTFVQRITEFYNNSKNFIVNCQKPDRKGKNKIYLYTNNNLI